MIELPKRLRIDFDGQHIGADIEPGASLPDALRTIAKSVEAIAKGDYEEITDFDEEIDGDGI